MVVTVTDNFLGQNVLPWAPSPWRWLKGIQNTLLYLLPLTLSLWLGTVPSACFCNCSPESGWIPSHHPCVLIMGPLCSLLPPHAHTIHPLVVFHWSSLFLYAISPVPGLPCLSEPVSPKGAAHLFTPSARATVEPTTRASRGKSQSKRLSTTKSDCWNLPGVWNEGCEWSWIKNLS